MRATNRFFGNLLLGGIRLKRLECELHEVPNNDEEELWSGRFRVPQNMLSLFELNRPYLLELDDGRQGRVVVHSISDGKSNTEKLAEFQPATNKKLRSDRET